MRFAVIVGAARAETAVEAAQTRGSVAAGDRQPAVTAAISCAPSTIIAIAT